MTQEQDSLEKPQTTRKKSAARTKKTDPDNADMTASEAAAGKPAARSTGRKRPGAAPGEKQENVIDAQSPAQPKQPGRTRAGKKNDPVSPQRTEAHAEHKPPTERKLAPKRNRNKSAPEDTQTAISNTAAVQETVAAPPAPAVTEPPFASEIEQRPGQKNPRPNRRRSSRGGKNDKGSKSGLHEDYVFHPEDFADVYPSAAQNTSGRFDSDVFLDEPQPALPNQPSLALLPASASEEELAALDEAVNGNMVESPAAKAGGKRQDRKQARQQKQQPKNMPAPKPAESGKIAPEAPAREPEKEITRIFYVSEVPEEQVELVITEDGKIADYFIEMAHQAKIRNNIYKGVINNLDTNLQAAFVNFGTGKNGFLQIDEVHPEYYLTHHDTSHGPKYPLIQKVLKVGQEVLVQVVKEPSGNKGAFLTTWVSMVGRFLVLTPGNEQIGISRKVEDQETRTRLKELITGIQPGEDLGVILRTASEGASKTNIQKDLKYLKRIWRDIRKKASTEKAPCLIYQEAGLAYRAVRDYLAEEIHEIWVDSAETLETIKETTNFLYPRRPDMVKLHQDPRQTLWERFNLQHQLEEIFSREVNLPSGGRVVFDQTEALMAIDINSGKAQGKSSFEDMVLRTNMEAADAIARHLRLRDIGGQVVIDFIEMRDHSHAREVEKALRTAMRKDRARHDIGRMSSFGLLELVRQRIGSSAISISSETCPYCRGTGIRRNMEWQALHALRDLQAKLSKNNPQKKGKDGFSANGVFIYQTSNELGLYLLNRKRDRIAELESKFGTHIEIAPN